MSEENLSKAEAALYDRQLRLWGVDAQKKLRKARILLIGISSLVGAEIAKNITLAGVGSLCVTDPNVASSSTTFLIKNTSVGQNVAKISSERLSELNPNVNVTYRIIDVSSLINEISLEQEKFKSEYDLVCVTAGATFQQSYALNELCRKNGILFCLADTFGFFGYSFSDFGEEYVYSKETKIEGGSQRTSFVKQAEKFCSFQESWNKTAKSPVHYLSKLVDQHCYTQGHIATDLSTINPENINNNIEPLLKMCTGVVAPVCAIVGGILGQEIIKAASRKDKPLNNCFFYDGKLSSGTVECL